MRWRDIDIGRVRTSALGAWLLPAVPGPAWRREDSLWALSQGTNLIR